jgi:2-oxoglutarate dehydrogenase E2 component (dihydrolipoamide succinyltransferase)
MRSRQVAACTYDHRVLDGREAVTLLLRIKQYVEDMRRMLIPSPI